MILTGRIEGKNFRGQQHNIPDELEEMDGGTSFGERVKRQMLLKATNEEKV